MPSPPFYLAKSLQSRFRAAALLVARSSEVEVGVKVLGNGSGAMARERKRNSFSTCKVGVAIPSFPGSDWVVEYALHVSIECW